MNSHKRRGRPSVCPGERSVGLHLRLPASEFDLVDKLSRQWRVSMQDLIRQMPELVKQQQAEIDRLEAQLDQLAVHYVHASYAEETSLTWTRLLMAQAQSNGNVVLAIQLFLDECPTDLHALLIRRLFEKWQRANTRNPGSVTEQDLWKAIGM
jgi:hypothetical protein